MSGRSPSISDLLKRRARRVLDAGDSRGGDTPLSFILSVVQQAPRPLAMALVFLLIVSASESLSVLMIVPVISFLKHGRSRLDIEVPQALTHLLGKQTLHVDLKVALVAFVGLISARAFAVRAKDLQVTKVLYSVTNVIRIDLLESISKSRWGFISERRTSDLNHALTADVDRIQTATTQLLLLAQAFILIVVYTFIAVFISPWMTAFAVGLGVFMLAAVRPIRRRAFDQGQTFLKARQAQFSTVSEFLAGMKIVKASNAEMAYVNRLASGLNALQRATLSYMEVSSLASLTFQIITAVALASFVAFAFLVANLSRETILILLFIFLRIGPRIMALQDQGQDILVNISSYSSIRQLERHCRAEAEPVGDHQPAPLLKSRISLNALSFKYPQGDRFALDRLDAVIPAFQITALISESGGGKSTLADLLLGLQDPTSGEILIDATPLAPELRRTWRNEVAYVPQDVFLLHDTLSVNLKLTSPDASDEQLWTALTAAQLDSVVRRSSLGLQTVIGERGMSLSGGERQRLAVARALLRRPQLLILDEATSALDWKNQAAIARMIIGLRGHCTVVTIAHRPSMIDFADWVIALEAGHLVETGSYRQLADDPHSRLARLLAAETS